MNHSKEEILVLTNEVPTKICPRCGKPRYLSDFYRKRKSADTYQSYCKFCDREYKKRRRGILEAKKGMIWGMRVADIVTTAHKADPDTLRVARKELESIIKLIDRRAK